MPLRLLPEVDAQIEIKDMLLRIAKLYQIPNFDAEGAVLLAEWVLDEYKHSSFELIKRALNSPPRTGEKSWRLTPETITEWIEVTRERMITETQQKESDERLNKPITEGDIKDETEKKLNELKLGLMEQMQPKQVTSIHDFKPRIKRESVAVGHAHRTYRKEYIKLLEHQGLTEWAEWHKQKPETDLVYAFKIEDQHIVAKDEEEARDIFVNVNCRRADL